MTAGLELKPKLGHWLVIHSLQSFSEHPDLIGVWSIGDGEPMYSPFSRIHDSDDVVYYAIRDCVIVGVFKVASGMMHVDDAKWGKSCVYRIAPYLLPPSGKVVDFKALLKDPSITLDLIPVKKNWPAYLRGHACRSLSARDFETFMNSMRGSKLISMPIVKPP
jgi:hypothetical protein